MDGATVNMAAAVDVEKLTFEVTDRVRGYLHKLIELGGSDLHIKAGSPIRARVKGDIIILSDEIMERNDALTLGKELMRGRFARFLEQKEIDLTFRLNDDYRFRVNAFFQKDGMSAVFRVIETKIHTLDELNVPEKLRDFASLKRGLILVVGMTGSGKSTTLSAIIDEINENYPRHILTIEDPIEFIHQDKKSMVTQRSIGEDTHSFANALRAALREDPDVILVGEMRDIETVEIALHAAETGHLVLSTLHTIDAQETINRIIGMFPPEEQARIRISLASVIRGIVAQRLVRTVDDKRAAAIEILVNTPRIVDLIRGNRDDEIRQSLEEGREVYKTQTFDQSLLDLAKNGVISEEEAIANATSREDLKLKLKSLSESLDVNTMEKGILQLKTD